MNEERVTRALKYRALMWHKATSFRAKPDIKKHSRTEISEDRKNVDIIVNVAAAKKEAAEATAKLRRSYWNLAIDAGKMLVRVLVDETVEQRPPHLESFWYNDREYKLQSVEGETARYVMTPHHNENMVKIKPITHAERIEKEIITMREMLAGDMLTALTPSEISESSEIA